MTITLDQITRVLLAYRKRNGYTRALILKEDGTQLMSVDEAFINLITK